MSTLELPVPYTSRGPRARRLALRRGVRFAGWALIAGIVVAWALLFRPQFLGGPAAYVMVSGMSMEPTLHNGDFVIAHRQERYRVGDKVVYRVPKGDTGGGSLIIHRIVGGSAASGWIVKGDNKDIPDLWRPKGDDVVGSLWVSVPGAGTLLAYAMSPFALAMICTFVALLIGLPAAAVEAVESRSRRRAWQGDKIAAAAAAAMALVAPLLRTDAVVVVVPKPRLPVPVSVRLSLAWAPPSARRVPSRQTRAASWGEAAWTARDLLKRLDDAA